MTFKIFNGRAIRPNSGMVKINKSAVIYFAKRTNIDGEFNLLWDEETNRIGFHLKKVAARKFNKANGGVLTSLKALAEEKGIIYPQICKLEKDEEIWTIKVKRTNKSGGSDA